MVKGLISLDCDGVLLDFSQAMDWWLRTEYPGIQISEAAHKEWDSAKCFGLDPATEQRMWEWCFQASLLPIDWADLLVDTLRSRGYELRIVTNRAEAGWDTLIEDLHTHFGIVSNEIIFTKNKHQMLKEIGALAHVDDNWRNADLIARTWEGSGKVSYLVDRPWNQSLDLAMQYKRIHSYMEVLNDWE